MRIHERDGLQRNLQLIFVPQEPRRLMPSELSEEIILTHPAQPFSSEFSRMDVDNTQGALAATNVDARLPDENRYFWVHMFQVTHDDPTARNITIQMRQDPAGVLVALAFEAALPTNRPLFLPRSVIVCPGFRLSVSANAMAAGQRMQIRAFQIEFFMPEICPQL